MDSRRHCTLCDTSVTSLAQLIDHVQGKKHKLVLLKTEPKELASLRRLQYILDKHVISDPVLGLEHVVEVPGNYNFNYTCLMCHKCGDCRRMSTHIFHPEHINNYILRHHPEMAIEPKAYSQLKDYYQALQAVAASIENKHGRKKIVIESAGFDCKPLLLPPVPGQDQKLQLPLKQPEGKAESAQNDQGGKGQPPPPEKSAKAKPPILGKDPSGVPQGHPDKGPSDERPVSPEYTPLSERTGDRSPLKLRRRFTEEKPMPDFRRRNVPERRFPPDFGPYGIRERRSPPRERFPPSPHFSRGLLREERVLYRENVRLPHQPPPSSPPPTHKSKYDDMTAVEELQFRSNEDFLEYLSKFQIDDDEDASYIQKIIQNCTNALCSFREKLSKGLPAPQPGPCQQAPPAQQTPSVSFNRTPPGLFGSRTAFNSAPVAAQNPAPNAAPRPDLFPLSMPTVNLPPMPLLPVAPAPAPIPASVLPLPPSFNPFPNDPATEIFFNSIKDMSETDVVMVLQNIAATNPAFRGIDIPSVIGHLKTTGRLKSS